MIKEHSQIMAYPVTYLIDLPQPLHVSHQHTRPQHAGEEFGHKMVEAASTVAVGTEEIGVNIRRYRTRSHFSEH